MFNYGYIAFIFSSIAFIPQMIHVYNTDDTDSLSFHTLILYISSQILWFAHSFQTMDSALRTATIINFSIYFYLIFKKITHVKKVKELF